MLTSRPTYRSADDGLDIIRTMREARFAHRVTCPHCGSALTVRWGGFAGRQRYRCKSCKRTFSDLTRTAFAYTKRIGSWPHYLVLVRQGRSLRAAAQQVGVHVSTAFRWRHSLLASMRAADSLVLDGTVELVEISFARSMKGSRNLARPRLRGSRTAGWVWHEVPHDRVLLAMVLLQAWPGLLSPAGHWVLAAVSAVLWPLLHAGLQRMPAGWLSYLVVFAGVPLSVCPLQQNLPIFSYKQRA